MIQIYGLRPWRDEKEQKDSVTNVHMGSVENMDDLFNGVFVETLTKKERYNLFYTIAHSKVQRREFVKQDYYLIDIDPEKDKEGNVVEPIDFTRIDEYVKILPKGGHVITSGNGIQALYKLKVSIDSKDQLKLLKPNNKIYCEHINSRLKEANLPGKFDTSVFKPGGLARIPGTENRKPMSHPFSDSVNLKHAVLQSTATPLGVFDLKLVFKCAFLQECYENSATLSEDLWYAAIDSMGNVDRAIIHTFSEGHPGYTREETDKKIDQARAATDNPRTCTDINERWGKCGACPYFQKCHSPSNLLGTDGASTKLSHGGTKENGFTYQGKKSKIRDYDALREYFKEEKHYVTMADTKEILIFNGKYYEQIFQSEIISFAEDNFASPVKESERKEFLNSVLANYVTRRDSMKPLPKNMVNMNNGILDILNKKLLPHSPEYYTLSALDCDYDPEAKAPVYQKLLENILEGCVTKTRVINEWGGYCLSGCDYHLNYVLILDGEGSNGKSSLCEAFSRVLGRGNCSSIPLQSMKKTFGAAGLEGKLVNFCEEEPPECFSDTGIIKQVTGNTPIEAQKKFQHPFDLLNFAKIIMTYNKIPFLRDITVGMLRRLLIVNFGVNLELKPELKIKDLYEKIENEKAGIVNIWVDGYIELQKRGDFIKTAESKQIVDCMVEASSDIQDFIYNYVEITGEEENKYPLQEVINHYTENYKVDKINPAVERKIIKEIKESLVRNEGVKYGRMRFNSEGGNTRLVGISGIKLTKDNLFIAESRTH